MIIAGDQFEPAVPIIQAWRAERAGDGRARPATPHDPDEWIRRFGALPLIHQPGEKWMYNAGSLVLGVLLARAAGRPLGDVLRERIFEPLGMARHRLLAAGRAGGRAAGQYMTDFEHRADGRASGQRRRSSGAHPPVFPSGSGRPGVHRGRLPELRADAARQGRARRHPAALRAVGRGDDHQPPDAGADRERRHAARRQRVGIRHGGHGRAGRGFRPRAVRLVRRLRHDWFNDPHEGLIAIALSQVTDLLWNGGLTDFGRLAYGK